MLTKNTIQKVIDGTFDLVKARFCVFNLKGEILASNIEDADKYSNSVVSFMNSPSKDGVFDGAFFIKINEDNKTRLVLVSQEENSDGLFANMVAFQLQELLVAYKERYDRENFIKNLLLDNLLLVDIYNRSKRLGIDMNSPRIVIILELLDDKCNDAVDSLKGMFNEEDDNFVTAVEEGSYIIVAKLPLDYSDSIIQGYVKDIFKLFSKYNKDDMRISYGTVVDELKDVSRSYKEASMALDVGRIFFKDQQVIAYSLLGIGRLIYQLPIPLCKMFIYEIFKKKLPSDFDEETIVTINKFFENSLNVSETSRQLFIHRNTLVYRLDKIQKTTGLDLRVFEDAITFKIALMVVEYMKHMEETL